MQPYHIGILASAIIGLSACTSTVPTPKPTEVTVFSSYEDKIPGTYAVVIDRRFEILRVCDKAALSKAEGLVRSCGEAGL